jgi:predicted ATPase
VETSATRWAESEVHRLNGELLRASTGYPTNGSECERCFQRALDVARGQSAKLLELRAASSLARQWRDAGRNEAARGVLAPAYESFAEGFETPDLKAAKALLEELGRGGP